MRHVEKHTDAAVVARHEQELAAAGLDKTSLLKRKQTEVLSGKTLYKDYIRSKKYIPHWEDLQNHLNKEQGGVCCYCGSKLFFPDTQHYSVEHVKPRNKYPELVGEYENLLLSCHSSEKERQVVKASALSKKERRKIYHCDEFKDNNELHYSPLDMNCSKHFSYKINGEVNGDDDNAKEDIKTLNLQSKGLVDRRKKAIQALLFSITNPEEMLDMESLNLYRQNIEKLDANGNHREFYFVIADVFDQYLNAGKEGK
jgi:uncharacterized protein (TIGR02646 family)